MANLKVYKVTHKVVDATRTRLIEAGSQAQAVRFAVADSISVELATVADAVELAKAGVQIERAGEEHAEAGGN